MAAPRRSRRRKVKLADCPEFMGLPEGQTATICTQTEITPRRAASRGTLPVLTLSALLRILRAVAQRAKASPGPGGPCEHHAFDAGLRLACRRRAWQLPASARPGSREVTSLLRVAT